MGDINNLKLHELYYILLVYSMHDDLITYDMELIWERINNYYFMDSNTILDINNEDDRNKLFTWLKDKASASLLDELMLNMFNRFINKEEFVDNRDMFFIYNIRQIKKIIDDCKVYIDNKSNNDVCNLSMISKDKVIEHVKIILREIDPSERWLNIYNKVLDDKAIIYLNELTSGDAEILKKKLGIDSFDDISNACIFLNKHEWYVILSYTGNISDVSTTIHEIVHYICRYLNKGKNEIPILREMPSIFYELYALNYLKRIGYSDLEINKINKDRLTDTYKSIDEVTDILNYLIILMDNGKITSVLDNNCDNVIYNLVKNPYILFEYYPYIIGNYLAIRGMDKYMLDNKILFKIKSITERLSRIDAYDVFMRVGYNEGVLVPTYKKNGVKVKSKVKGK